MDDVGVSPRYVHAVSGYPLQVLAAFVPQAAVGFPLLSLTRNARPVRTGVGVNLLELWRTQSISSQVTLLG